MLFEDRISGREVVARVESVVAEEPERRATELVGARLGEDVDDAAGGASDLRRVACWSAPRISAIASIDGLDANRADGALVVVHAVNQLIVLVVGRAVDRDGGRLPPIVGTGAARERVGGAFVRARQSAESGG